MRLAVRGDKVNGIGVYFTSADGTYDPVRIPAGQLSPNQPGKFQSVLPPYIGPGQWRVKVATQSLSKAKAYTKEVREYGYPNIITVV